jgi:hypothetical protein
MTSVHFPFYSPSNIFFIASKIKELAFSTALFDCGWYTYANATFVPICWQNSLNIALSKYFAFSTVMCLGTPYRQIMFCQKKLFNCGRAHICEWLRFYPLREVLNYDYCESVIALCWGQLSYNVDAPSLQGQDRAISFTGYAGAFVLRENL